MLQNYSLKHNEHKNAGAPISYDIPIIDYPINAIQ